VTVKPLLVLLHDLGCDAGTYAETLRHPALREVETWAPDLPGHGSAPGRRFSVLGFADLISEELTRRGWRPRPHQSRPLVVAGHGVGGLVALLSAAELRLPHISLEGSLLEADCDLVCRAVAGESQAEFASSGMARLLQRVSTQLSLPSRGLGELACQTWARSLRNASPLAVHDAASSTIRWAETELPPQLLSGLPSSVYIRGSRSEPRRVLPRRTRTAVVQGAGHFLMLDQPQLLAELLAEQVTLLTEDAARAPRASAAASRVNGKTAS
jgi:pimeloyl-ACP methyl ester carboxylesterase